MKNQKDSKSKAKLTPVSWSDLVKTLQNLGFDGPYCGGKHPFMVKGDLVLTIPNLHRKEIGVFRTDPHAA